MIGDFLVILSTIYFQCGKREFALATCGRAEKIFKELLGDNCFKLIEIYTT
jgi:hypothetical protein